MNEIKFGFEFSTKVSPTRKQVLEALKAVEGALSKKDHIRPSEFFRQEEKKYIKGG